MKTTMFLSLAMSAGLALAADPLVSNVSASQGAGTRKVTVSYALANEPAVITVDVQTNRGDGVWVSIGADKQASITGGLNKLVQPGNHAVVWDARQDWPDQLRIRRPPPRRRLRRPLQDNAHALPQDSRGRCRVAHGVPGQ